LEILGRKSLWAAWLEELEHEVIGQQIALCFHVEIRKRHGKGETKRFVDRLCQHRRKPG
jgi:hypothetical protein